MSHMHEGSDHGSTSSTPPGTPRWVKLFGMAVVVVVLLVIILMFAVGGNHGPGRHLPSGGMGDVTSPVAQKVQRG